MVLDATMNQHLWLVAAISLAVSISKSARTAVKSVIDSPHQDPTRAVIDDCMRIGFAAIEKLDERGVNMPDLVMPSGPDANRWLSRMNHPRSVDRGTPCRTANSISPVFWIKRRSR